MDILQFRKVFCTISKAKNFSRLSILNWIVVWNFAAVSLSSLCIPKTFAQSTESNARVQSIRYTQNLYNQYFENNSQLLIGSEYNELAQSSDGHPFFLFEEFISGEIIYDFQHYDNVPLLFDLVRGDILTKRSGDAVKVKLAQERVQEFTISGHRFVRLMSLTGIFPGDGFYEVLHQGIVSAYARWDKRFTEDLSNRSVRIFFPQKTKYFIEKDGAFFSVKNKKSLLMVFKDKKELISQYIKRSNIQFSNDKGKVISLVTEYYNSIKGNP